MALVLQTMLEHGPRSKAQIARLTGLSKSSVGPLIAAINSIRPRPLIVEESVSRGGLGRPATVLVLDAGAVSVLGAAVYVDRVDLVHVDLAGKVTRRRRSDFPHAIGADLLARVLDAVELERTAPVIALGVCVPGIVDPDAGSVNVALELDWHRLPLSRIVQARTGLPCLVMNLSAAGAFDDAHATGTSNLLRLTVGTGVGAGLIYHGEVVTGHHHQAGELGHVRVKVAGARPCRCGQSGCLEAEVNCDAVAARLRERGFEPSLGCGYEDLARAERDRPEAAAAVRRELACLFAEALTVAMRLLDPQAIPLGGHITHLGPPLMEELQEEMASRRLGGAAVPLVRFSDADPATGVARYALNRLATDILIYGRDLTRQALPVALHPEAAGPFPPPQGERTGGSARAVGTAARTLEAAPRPAEEHEEPRDRERPAPARCAPARSSGKGRG